MWGCAAIFVFCAIGGFLLLGGLMTTVDPGETCAVVTRGQVSGTWDAGWHFHLPWTSAVCYSNRSTVYEVSREPEKSSQEYRDHMVDTQTSDGQTIHIAYSAVFAVPVTETLRVYTTIAPSEFELVNRVVVTLSRSEVRNAFRGYKAEDLYSEGVEDVQAAVGERLRALFVRQGVALQDFLIREVEFDPDYLKAIEDQQIAQEGIKTSGFQASAVATAAAGEAQARVERAGAKATEIALEGQAIRDNPEVVRLRFIENQKVQWGILPPNSDLVPLFDVNRAFGAQGETP
jgi:regulator of protease activity HflC (stomatin/prohibitin superfamily)